MEASRSVIARPSLVSQDSRGRLGRGLRGPLEQRIRRVGEILIFSGRSTLGLAGVWRYTAEVLRQVGILIAGSAVVIWVGNFVFGLTCAQELTYTFRGFGASSYMGTVTAVCHARMPGAMVVGWFFAAKVGAGFAAELGAMRVTQELDGMEALGVDTMKYVVGTRLAAVLLAFPLIVVIGYYVGVAGYLVTVNEIGTISQGVFSTVHWQYDTPRDLFFGFVLVMIELVMITLISLYYGFTARGGPIGVGRATATAMAVNLTFPLITQAVIAAIFWGPNDGFPIGG